MHVNVFEDLEQLITPASMNSFMELVDTVAFRSGSRVNSAPAPKQNSPQACSDEICRIASQTLVARVSLV